MRIMARLALYKYVLRTDGEWRYCKAVTGANGKIRPDVVLVQGKEERHEEGCYYILHNKKWINVGEDSTVAEHKRKLLMNKLEADRLSGRESVVTTPAQEGQTPLAAAVEKYFSNLEAQGKDPKTITAYRAAINPFAANCGKQFVEDVDRQDMLDYMAWLRKQPNREQSNSNPSRTYANKVGHCAIFLKSFGVTKLLKKSEYPKFHAKKIVAHTDAELALLYAHADAEETFLLDFFIGSMARDAEAYNCKFKDLTGTTLTLYGKQSKTRTVEISPRLAASINERRTRSKSEYLFVNRKGNPNQHLLRDLQNLAKRARATFHCELHELRKTGASRRYRSGCLLDTLMYALGHNSLSTTQIYLSDVHQDETKKAVAAADFIPVPQIVRTGTDGD
jgi:integrase/recombinase XerD